MILGLAFRLVLGIFITSLTPTYASVLTSQISHKREIESCTQDLDGFVPATLRNMRRLVEEQAASIEKFCPEPNLRHIEEACTTSQIRDPHSPRFFDYILPEQNGLVARARSTSPDKATIGLLNRYNTWPLYSEIKPNSRTLTTTAFITSPNRMPLPKPGHAGKKRWQIDARHKFGVALLHGGGALSAGGHSGTEVGEAIVSAAGVPTLTFDSNGHAHGPMALENFKDGRAWTDYFLDQIDANVDPSVKLVGYGHSWGAQAMIQLWLRRHEPRVRNRFIEFIAGSPPPDESLGTGDCEVKARSAIDWAKRMNGAREQGTFSSTGALHVQESNRHYLTRPMTWDEVNDGPRLTIVMGTKDEMCYLDKEHIHRSIFPEQMFLNFESITDWEKFMDDPNRKSSFILLGDQKNHKTRKRGPDVVEPTGHQVGDAIIAGTDEDGSSGKRFIWELISRAVLSRNEGKPFEIDNEDTLDPILNYVAKSAARDPAARQLIEHDVQFVQQNAEGFETIHHRKRELDKYQSDVATARKSDPDMERRYTREELGKLAQELGLGESLSVNDSLARLGYADPNRKPAEQKRLEPIAPEMRETLENFVKLRDQIEPDMKRKPDQGGWVDEASDAEELAAAEAVKQVIGEPTWTLQQVKDRNAQIGREKGMKMPKPHRDAFGKFINTLAVINKFRKERFATERNIRTNALPRPPGVDFDVNEAHRRLRVEADPERYKLYKQFYARSEEALQRAKDRVQAEQQTRVKAVPLPVGVSSEKEADEAIQTQKELLGMAYAPSDHPELGEMVRRMAELKVEMLDDFTTPGKIVDDISKRANFINDKRQARQGLVRNYTTAVENPAVISPRYQAYWTPEKEAVKAKLHAASDAYELALYDHRRKLDSEGRHTAENMQNAADENPEVRRTRDVAHAVEDEYAELTKPIPELRKLDALGDKLIANTDLDKDAPALVAQASSAAKQVWGESAGENLTDELRRLEDELEEKREKASRAEYKLGMERIRYLNRLRELNLPVPYVVHRVVMRDLLRKVDPAKVIAAMEKNDEESKVVQLAWRQWKKRYEDIHTELVQVNQGAKEEN